MSGSSPIASGSTAAWNPPGWRRLPRSSAAGSGDRVALSPIACQADTTIWAVAKATGLAASSGERTSMVNGPLLPFGTQLPPATFQPAAVKAALAASWLYATTFTVDALYMVEVGGTSESARG